MRKFIDIINEAHTSPVRDRFLSARKEGKPFGTKTGKAAEPKDDAVLNAARSIQQAETPKRRLADVKRRATEVDEKVEAPVSMTGSDENAERIEAALNDLGYAFSKTDKSAEKNESQDGVLNAMVKVHHTVFDVQFSKKKSRARDVLTEIAREAGLDLQVDNTTQAADGSTWLHCYLRDGDNLVAVAASRDASRHRDHPDFGSYLFISVKAIEDEAEETRYTKKDYVDTDQRECVKVTNPAGDVVYDGPKTLFKSAPVEEEITGYKQLPGTGTEPEGSLPDMSLDDVKAERDSAAKRVMAKRAERAKQAG